MSRAGLPDRAAPPGAAGHYFVKRLLTLALDRRDKEREMASSLLSSLLAQGGQQLASAASAPEA